MVLFQTQLRLLKIHRHHNFKGRISITCWLFQRAVYEKPLRVRDASEYTNHLLWLIDNDSANPDLQFATIPHWQKLFEIILTMYKF